MSMFFGYNSIYLTIERLRLLEHYRIGRTPGRQKSTAANLSFTLIRAAIGKALINPLLVWYVLHPIMIACGSPPFDAPVPSTIVMAGQFSIAYWFNEFFFYWGHRLLHTERLYATFHKEHHNYTGTVGFAAEHAGIVEQILSNIGPTMGGCVLFGRHPFVLLVWIAKRLFSTYDGHSGYCLSGTYLVRMGLLNCTAYHDYHHSFSFRGNFGHPFLDYCFGTMDYWVKDGGESGYVHLQREREEKSTSKSKKS